MCLLGFIHLAPTLGWSVILLPVAWAVLFAASKRTPYSRSILNLAVILYGFIAINHLGTLVSRRTISASPIWLFVMQMVIVWGAFAQSIADVTKNRDREGFRTNKPVGFFRLWLVWPAIWFMSVFYPVWASWTDPANLALLMFVPTLLSGFVVFIMLARTSTYEFERLIEAPMRLPEYRQVFKRISWSLLPW